MGFWGWGLVVSYYKITYKVFYAVFSNNLVLFVRLPALHILRKTNKDQMVFSLQITILTVCYLYFEMCWLPRIKIKNNNTENLLTYILQWILMFFSPSYRPVCVARGRSVHLPAQGTSAAAPGRSVGSASSDDDRMFVPRRPMASSLADLSSTGPAGDSDSGVDSGPAKSRSNPAKQILNSLVCGAKTTNRNSVWWLV